MTAGGRVGPAGAGRLLGLGVRAALSTPGPVLGVALTLAAAAFAGSAVFPALVAGPRATTTCGWWWPARWGWWCWPRSPVASAGVGGACGGGRLRGGWR